MTWKTIQMMMPQSLRCLRDLHRFMETDQPVLRYTHWNKWYLNVVDFLKGIE